MKIGYNRRENVIREDKRGYKRRVVATREEKRRGYQKTEAVIIREEKWQRERKHKKYKKIEAAIRE